MISKRRRISHGCLAVTLFLLVSMVLSLAVFADGTDSTAQTTSLTVVNQAGNVPIPDAPFQLYLVATVTQSGHIRFAPEFADFGVALVAEEESEDDNLSDTAVTLENYVVAMAAEDEPIEPVASVETDENGMAQFPDLPEGLYLLVGQPVTIDETVYTPLAMLITLYDETTDNQSDLTVYTKVSKRTVEPSPMDLTVLKIWADDDNAASQRPSEVTVTLYGDEEVYDTVTLSSQNNWRYTWENLDDTVDWHLVEIEVPDNYTVTAVQEGTVFVVTNTYVPEPTPTPAPTPTATPSPTPEPTETPEPTVTPVPTETPEPTVTPVPTATPEPSQPPVETPKPTEPPVETPVPTEPPALIETPAPTDTPSPTDTPEPTEPPALVETPEPTDTPEPTETPTETPEPTETPTLTETPAPTTTPTPTTTTTTSNPKLPQTGQLWWPIVVLAMAGLAMILLGVGIRRRGNDHHEE
jgi:LPXTG-motif cell wall-anchored protein